MGKGPTPCHGKEIYALEWEMGLYPSMGKECIHWNGKGPTPEHGNGIYALEWERCLHLSMGREYMHWNGKGTYTLSGERNLCIGMGNGPIP